MRVGENLAYLDRSSFDLIVAEFRSNVIGSEAFGLLSVELFSKPSCMGFFPKRMHTCRNLVVPVLKPESGAIFNEIILLIF